MREGAGAAAENRRPAVLANRASDAGLDHPFGARHIHDLQVAAVVHVTERIEIMRQYAKAALAHMRVMPFRAGEIPEPDQQ